MARRTTAWLLIVTVIIGGIVYFVRSKPSPGALAPGSVAAIKARALRFQNEKNWPALLKALDQIPVGSPDKAIALAQQAKAYWELNRGLECEHAAASCLALDADLSHPSHATVSAWGILADHYLGQERFSEFRDVVWKLHEAHRNRSEINDRFLFLISQPRFEITTTSVAVERLAKFVEDAPLDHDSHRAFAIYLGRLGQLDKARQHLEPAAIANPDIPRFQDIWMTLLLLANDQAAIDTTLAAWGDRFDDRPEFWVHRAKVFERKAQWQKAVECYKRALQLEPRKVDANNLLCQALRQAGDSRELSTRSPLARELAEAHGELSGIYQKHSVSPEPIPSPVRKRIAALCRTLGWQREADEWEALP